MSIWKEHKDWIIYPAIFLFVLLGLKWYRTPNFSNGGAAPNFVGYLPNGDSLQLDDFKGDLVLLDFWGSWCGPCREANVHLVELYDKYKDAKFRKENRFVILSVGIETKKTRWLNAIKKDNLYWPYHVSDLKRLNDHVALLYGIKEIPTTYLIDGEQQIIGVNLSDIKLEELLTHRLQK